MSQLLNNPKVERRVSVELPGVKINFTVSKIYQFNNSLALKEFISPILQNKLTPEKSNSVNITDPSSGVIKGI